MKDFEQFTTLRRPAPRLLRRGDDRIYGIIHFSINTFTDREWGFGDEAPELFNPTAFDAQQIVGACRDGGLGGLILVCKHHDGFCLWPTATTSHNISRSPWRDGRGDMVREFADACRAAHLRFGVYVSPWDRNHPDYGYPAYCAVFRAQLRELLTGYGELFEVWFDGANGGDGYYGGARETRRIDRATYYDWAQTWRLVRDLQPGAAIFSDVGPDLRWVGNEKGFAAPECFGSFTPRPAAGESDAGPGCTDDTQSPFGQADGQYYIPPECDVPLRPGWFYHASEDGKLRSVALLREIYLNSVGNGGFLNLGLAPDRRGLLHENDVARLREFQAAVEQLHRHRVAAGCFPAGGGEVELGGRCDFNFIDLHEAIEDGERIDGYTLSGYDGGAWRPLLRGRAIGARRLRCLPPSSGTALRLEFSGDGAPVTFQLHLTPEAVRDAAHFDLCDRPDYRALSAALTTTRLEQHFEAPVMLHGFIFSPDTQYPGRAPRRYRLAVRTTADAEWRVAAAGEFANLSANPIPQVVEFPARPVCGIRLEAEDGAEFLCAAFGILTED